MAVSLAWTADGGTNGTTVSAANSGGTSGPAWDSVTANTANGATLAYDTAHTLGGHPLAVKLATGGTATTCFTQWSTSLTASGITQTWFRLYAYLTGIPAANFRIWQCLNGSTTCAALQILSTGKLRMLDTSGVAITTSTASVPAGQWFRVEGFVLASATAGQTEVRLYSAADAGPQNYTEINTSAASQNTSTAITITRFGVGTSVANVAAWWMASPGASDTGYLGPEAPVTGVPAAVPGPAWLNRFRQFPRRPVAGQDSAAVPVALPGPAAGVTATAPAGSVATVAPGPAASVAAAAPPGGLAVSAAASPATVASSAPGGTVALAAPGPVAAVAVTAGAGDIATTVPGPAGAVTAVALPGTAQAAAAGPSAATACQAPAGTVLAAVPGDAAAVTVSAPVGDVRVLASGPAAGILVAAFPGGMAVTAPGGVAVIAVTALPGLARAVRVITLTAGPVRLRWDAGPAGGNWGVTQGPAARWAASEGPGRWKAATGGGGHWVTAGG